MIELNEESYVVGFWFIQGHLPGGGPHVNFLACLLKEGEGWKLKYRFLYIKDDKIVGSADTFSNWSATLPPMPEEEAELKTQWAAEQAAAFLGPLEYVPVHGNGLRAAKILSEQTWAHPRVETMEKPQ